ncbi:MAG: hypothetical protein ACPGRD_02960 [Planktomarina sp.]
MKQATFLAIVLGLFTSFACADGQNLPALYNVSNVATNDTLNVRRAPSGSADIVVKFPHNALNVEIIKLSPNGRWGMTNVGEGTGWLSMAYLERQSGQRGFPKLNHCYGTEPFWNLRFERATLVLDDLGAEAHRASPLWRTGSANVTNVFGFGASDMHAVLIRETCHDGMSDREFGYRVELLQGNGPGTRMVSGCCSLN